MGNQFWLDVPARLEGERCLFSEDRCSGGILGIAFVLIAQSGGGQRVFVKKGKVPEGR